MAKTVLITGSSSGIGKATANEFQRQGWNVAATMRSPGKSSLSESTNLKIIALDVTDSDSIKRAIESTLEKFSKIDCVVNNAGYGLVGPFEASTSEGVQRQFDTNVFGLMNVVREILPHFREQKSGVIVNVSSMGGRVTFPLYSLYHATKWAVEGFSESLHFEVQQFNIRIKLIEPGPIKTDFYDRSMDVMSKPELKAYDQFVSRAMNEMQNAGARAPGPEMVAKVIYGAATDNSSKLRYPVNSEAILALRKLLPDGVFNSIVKKIVLK